MNHASSVKASDEKASENSYVIEGGGIYTTDQFLLEFFVA